MLLLLVLMASSVTINFVATAATTTTPSMLIIRHGRSRVRHINENDHIRWGLQAFDNLTLDDYDTTTSSTDPSSTVDLLNDGSSSSASSLDLTGSQLFGSDFWFGSDGSNNLNGNVSSLINQTPQPIGNSKRKSTSTSDFPTENILDTSHQVS